MGVVYDLSDFTRAKVPVWMGKNGTLDVTVMRDAIVRKSAMKAFIRKRRPVRVADTDKVLQFPVI